MKLVRNNFHSSKASPILKNNDGVCVSNNNYKEWKIKAVNEISQIGCCKLI